MQDAHEGVQVCAAWGDAALFESYDPEFYSFDFFIRGGNEPGADVWVDLGSSRGDTTGGSACLRIGIEDLSGAVAGLDEDEPWLRVEGMARSGHGRATRVHRAQPAYLTKSDLPVDEGGERVSATLGPEGGTLSLEGPNGQLRAQLMVPEGALDGETTVEIRLESDPELTEVTGLPGTAVFLSPSGLTFRSPASLLLSFDSETLPEGIDPTELAILRVAADGSYEALPSTVDMDDRSVAAELMGFSLYLIAQPDPQVPIATWVGGASPDPTDWHNPDNWSPSDLAPFEGGFAVIPAAASFFPQVRSSLAEIRFLRIDAGASLHLHDAGLRVTGELVAEGTVTSDGPWVFMDGDGTQPIRGRVPNLWVSHQGTELSGNLVVEGDVEIGGTRASLEVGEHRLEILGDLGVLGGSSEARLFMDHPFGHVIVHGDARFQAAWDGAPPLQNGTLELRGNLDQTTNPGAFRAASQHFTLFNGNEGIQTVRFEHPGREASSFQYLEIGNTHEVMLLSDAHTDYLAWTDAGVGSRISGGAALGVRSAANIRGPVSVSELRVGGILSWNGSSYLVPTTVFTGDGPEVVQPQRIPAIPYLDVVVMGEDATLEDEFVQVRSDFRIEGGSFRPGAGRLLTVQGNLSTRDEGSLFMAEGDRVVVYGSVDFEAPSRSPGLGGGRLWVGGDLLGQYGAGVDHFTILFGSEVQGVKTARAPGSLAITNAGEGVHLHHDESPIYFLDLVGNTRVLEGLWISVIHVNYRSTSQTHFEAGASFNCTTAWFEEGGIVTSDWTSGGCNPPLAGQHGQLDPDRRPPLELYAVPSPLTVEILSPAPDTEVREGDPVSFSATARFEGEPVSATYTWTSSLDGTLGSGASLSTDALSAGVHSVGGNPKVS